MSDYARAATRRFESLLAIFPGTGGHDYENRYCSSQSPAFWRCGNSFDTLIDYLDHVDDNAAGRVAAAVAANTRHLTGDDYDRMWFDDFGWWSVAAQRALTKGYFSARTDLFQSILDNCWTRFSGNAPFVWERRAPGRYDDCGPAIPGGVWNDYWTGTPVRKDWPGPRDGNPDAGQDTLDGIQNTVTNALYLLAAQRLSRRDNPSAAEAARAEHAFFMRWIADPDCPLLRPLDTDGTAGLMRERVGYLAGRNPAPGFLPDWAWTGDQGLVLGALSDAAMASAPGFADAEEAAIAHIAKGVPAELATGGILQWSNDEASAPAGDACDYQTGTGVFWRNVLHVDATNPRAAALLDTPEMRSILKASADAAMQRPVSPKDFETQSNDLSVLVAAHALLGG